MANRFLRRRMIRGIMVLGIPGAMTLGTSCAEAIRDSVVSAGLSFVEDTAGAFLEAVVPVDAVIPGE